MTKPNNAEKYRAEALRLLHEAQFQLDQADNLIFSMSAPSRGRRSFWPAGHANAIAAESRALRELTKTMLKLLGECDPPGVSDVLELLGLDLGLPSRETVELELKKRRKAKETDDA